MGGGSGGGTGGGPRQLMDALTVLTKRKPASISRHQSRHFDRTIFLVCLLILAIGTDMVFLALT